MQNPPEIFSYSNMLSSILSSISASFFSVRYFQPFFPLRISKYELAAGSLRKRSSLLLFKLVSYLWCALAILVVFTLSPALIRLVTASSGPVHAHCPPSSVRFSNSVSRRCSNSSPVVHSAAGAWVAPICLYISSRWRPSST